MASMIDNYLKALYSINNLALETYTENPTIINGGGVYKIDSVKDREWYQKYVESGQDMFVMFSYDTESGAVTAPHRRLYIIKAIGNPTKDKYKKLCRVVIDYGFFSRKMESVVTGAEGYIADDENVFVYTGGMANVQIMQGRGDRAAELLKEHIHLEEDIVDGFLTVDDVKRMLTLDHINPQGQSMAHVNLRLIEETLQAKELIESVECYKGQDGRVCITICQRIPVIRVINDHG